MERIENSSCKEVFEYFKELNTIPRASGNEQAISDWLVNFAKENKLEVIQDEALNIIISKAGTKGYENSDTIILQGHMDMVAEKAEDSDHDFEKDPIKFIVDGDTIHADNTTLGADNGIAIAYALAILASDDTPHPPLEVLITTSEETGMDGAIALDINNLKGRKLLNLDSEAEGELLVSCAGGVDAFISLPLVKNKAANETGKKIQVTGLFGGHSGMEIHKQRGNAIKILSRVLYDFSKENDFELASLEGGTKLNAIPRKASAIINIDSRSNEILDKHIEKWNKILKDELESIDDGVELVLADESQASTDVYSKETRDNILNIISLLPNGVINMSPNIEGLVQTSNNLGIVEISKDTMIFKSAIRSSVNSMKFEVSDKLEQLSTMTGAGLELSGYYPEWKFKKDSELRDAFIEVYIDKYGKEPIVNAIHAGLECGIFDEKFEGDIDLISFGPNIHNAHTPKENMEIPSVERTFDLLKDLLSHLK